MREIKFRVWDNNSKIYYYNNIKIFGSGEFSIIDECNGSIEAYNGDSILSDLILEQYTGLKDKNGKEIYEGDILLNDDFEEEYVCEYLKNVAGFVGWGDDRASGCYLITDDNIEIIGNIHEEVNNERLLHRLLSIQKLLR